MLLLLVPLLLYAYGRANVSQEDLAVQKAEFAVHRLVSISDSVGYLGGNAAIIDEVEMPNYVKSLTVNGKDIVMELSTASGKRQIVQSSAFQLDGEGLSNIKSPGTYFIEVRALSNFSKGAKQVELSLK